VIYILNVITCIMPTTQKWNHVTKKSLFLCFKYLLRFVLVRSENSSSSKEKNEQIKNTIRETLHIDDYELDETSCTNAPHEGIN
jgi:hypothetical protein